MEVMTQTHRERRVHWRAEAPTLLQTLLLCAGGKKKNSQNLHGVWLEEQLETEMLEKRKKAKSQNTTTHVRKYQKMSKIENSNNNKKSLF